MQAVGFVRAWSTKWFLCWNTQRHWTTTVSDHHLWSDINAQLLAVTSDEKFCYSLVLFFNCPIRTMQKSEIAFCLYTSAKIYRCTLTSNNKVNGISFCTCCSIFSVSISLYNTQIPLWNTMSCNKTHPTACHAMPIVFRCYKLLVFIFLLPVLFLYQVILLMSGDTSLQKLNFFLW